MQSLNRQPRQPFYIEKFASLLAQFYMNTHAFHLALARYNSARITPGIPTSSWMEDEQQALVWRLQEGMFLDDLRVKVAGMMQNIPRSPDQFVQWFESLAEWGPGQQDTLFDWLAKDATLDQMRWFLTQEVAGEAGFDDLLAYTQVKLPVQAKLECARNFWDEMGHGKQGAMHGLMLERMACGLDLCPSIETTIWESLALGNAMLGMALTRRYAFHSLGALGVIELTAPGRASKVSQGMRRLGMDAKMRAYFDLHAALDVSHSRCWNREIIHSLVTSDPAYANFIAEGALMRLYCGQLCFKRYRLEFGLDKPPSASTIRSRASQTESVLC
jgi:Iron-containing redox enzyme